MNPSVDLRTATQGLPSDAAVPRAGRPTHAGPETPASTTDAVTLQTPPQGAVPAVDGSTADSGGPVPLAPLSGTDADRLDQFRAQLGRHLGLPADRIVVRLDGDRLVVRPIAGTVVGQTVSNLKDVFGSPWQPVTVAPADQAWVRRLVQGSSSDRLDRLRLVPVDPAPASKTAGVITVSAITAGAQTQQFIADAMKREIVAIADSLRQQPESIELRFDDQQRLTARNRYSGAVYEVRLPQDAYTALRHQLIRQNPTTSLATLGGTTLLTEVQVGGQVLGTDGAAGSTFVESMKVTYTSPSNWTFGAGVLTSQQLDGDNRQGARFRIGHNYWGVADVLVTPEGQVEFRGLQTRAPREAWNWVTSGSKGRLVGVLGGAVAGVAATGYALGKGKKAYVFSNPLPELELGRHQVKVVGGVLGQVSLGGSDDGSFRMDGKLTGGTLRLKETGKGGVSNEQGLRYRREHKDDGTFEHVLQGDLRGNNRLGAGYVSHQVLVGYDLETKSLAQSMAAAQVTQPFGDSQKLSWNAGGAIGIGDDRKVSYGDVRAGILWQPSPSVSIFGSAGYIKGSQLMDPNLAGGLVGSMMPKPPRGEVQGPNQALGGVVGDDKGRMGVTIGAYIRL